MARKKKEAEPTNEFQIDISNLSLTKEKYIDQIRRYIQEQLPTGEVNKSGNFLNITVPESITKRMVRMRVNKIMYQTGLKGTYRLVSIIKGDGNGYMIIER
jgi:hypothetical protein